MVLGCRGPAEHSSATAAPGPEPTRQVEAPAPVFLDAAVPLAEAPARAVLAESFRSYGLRIRYDVPIEGTGYELTVDGYDPVVSVGYEYLAPIERDTDLVAAERIALAADRSRQILILDPVDEAGLRARIDEFLAGLRTP